MKKTIALIVSFIPMVLAMGQQLKNTNLELDQWGSHRSLISYRGVSAYPMTVDGDGIYFKGVVNKFAPHDTLYCFNTAKNQITNSVLYEGKTISTPDGLRLFYVSKDKDNLTVSLKSCLLDRNSLEHKSEKNILSANIDKRGDYSWYLCVSPDSSKIGILVGVDYGDTRNHLVVLYDRLADNFEVNRVNFELSSSFYSIVDLCLTDEGKMFVMTKSHDDEKTKKSSAIYFDANLVGTDGSVEKVTFPLPKNSLFQDFKCKALHNGNIIWAMTVANDGRKWTDESLFYNLINPKNFESATDVKEYKFQDVWLEKQKVSFKKYSFMGLDNLVELDNGKMYAIGFPRRISTVCNKNGCSNVNYWGGFYCLGITENGDIDDFNYIERMAKKMKSDLSSLKESNFWYDVVTYGNNLYLTFNEAVNKIEKGKITASVTQKDKKAYLMMYRVGEDGLKEFNLSGSVPSDRLFNSYLGRQGNKLYYLTRNNHMGSISCVEMPEVALKDFTRKLGQKKVSKVANSSTANKKTTVSTTSEKKSTGGRGRKVKR